MKIKINPDKKAEVLDIYTKVLQLVKQYLIEKDDEIKNDTGAK